MGGELAELFVRVGADTRGLRSGLADGEQALSRTEQRWQQTARGMEQTGSTLTRNLTLPLIAAGAIATKTAIDFDTSLSRMQGLAGVAADEIGGIRDRIMELSHETSIGPQQLADAMYFIASSGIKGAAAMDALEASAKASAAGLGDVAQVADAVTSAMNAYGPEVLSASEATDVLVGMVREGKGEASEFAGQLGRILPFAAQLGVSFADLGAGLAYLTQGSGDTRLATTQLGGALQHLLVPSKQGRDVLEEVGLSADGVRQMIQEKGLLGALVELDNRFGGSEENWKSLVEEGQAVAGILSLVKNGGEDAAPVFEQLGDSAGATDDAFRAFAESAGFESAQAFADLQAALIELGDVIVPMVSDFAKAGAGIASFFAGLPGPVQTGTLAFLAFAAALGPMLSIGGNLLVFGRGAMVALSGLGSMLMNMIVPTQALTISNLELAASQRTVGTSSLAAAGLLGLFAAAIAVVAFNYKGMDNAVARIGLSSDEAASGAAGLIKAMTEGATAADAMGSAAEATAQSNQELADAFTLSGVSASEFSAFLADADPADVGAKIFEMAAAVEAAGGNADAAVEHLLDYAVAQDQSAKAAINAAKAQGLITDAQAHAAVEATRGADGAANYSAALERLPGIAGEASDELGGMGDAAAAAEQQLQDMKAAIEGLFAAALGTEGARIQFQLGLLDMQQAIAEGTFTLDESTQAGLQNRQALIGMANDAKTHAAAVYEETGSIDAANFTLGAHISQLAGVMQQTGMSEESAAQYIATLLGIPSDQTTSIHTNADLVEIVMANLRDTVNEIPRTVHIGVIADTAGAAAAIHDIRTAAQVAAQVPRYGNGESAAVMNGAVAGIDSAPTIPATSTPGAGLATITTVNNFYRVSLAEALARVPGEVRDRARSFLEGRN